MHHVGFTVTYLHSYYLLSVFRRSVISVIDDVTLQPQTLIHRCVRHFVFSFHPAVKTPGNSLGGRVAAGARKAITRSALYYIATPLTRTATSSPYSRVAIARGRRQCMQDFATRIAPFTVNQQLRTWRRASAIGYCSLIHIIGADWAFPTAALACVLTNRLVLLGYQ